MHKRKNDYTNFGQEYLKKKKRYFRYKNRMFDSVFLRENADQRKPSFCKILCGNLFPHREENALLKRMGNKFIYQFSEKAFPVIPVITNVR